MARMAYQGIKATTRAQARLGLVFSMPAALITGVFIIAPVGSAVYLAMTNWNGVTKKQPFVGLANFRAMFTDPLVWHSLENNAIWIAIGTFTPLFVGLILAVLLWSRTRGAALYRVVYLLPYVMPSVVIAITWGWIYDPINGWLNRALTDVGLTSLTRGWLGEPAIVLYAILFAGVWSSIGFSVVILLAALQNVDQDLMDSARMDGANPARRLWHVILPQITPVFLMLTTITLVGGFSVFDIVFVMTNGGPDNASSVIGTYAYQSAFVLDRVGYGTAMALLMVILALPFIVILNRLQRKLSLQGMAA
jgi:raffinose/stachyose/melibiose transport system permease protein